MKSEFLKNQKSFSQIIAWILFVTAPIAAYYMSLKYGIPHPTALFFGIIVNASLMWFFSFTPEYVPGIFVIVAALILDIAPPKVILSGFSSEVFVMVFSVLCISVVISQSGLITRMLLKALHYTRKKPILFDRCFFTVFTILTPFVPSIASRLELAAESISMFAEKWGVTAQNGGFNRLVTSSFHGGSLFGTVFLSASLLNFMAILILPLHEQLRFSFVLWFKAAAIAFIVLLLGFCLLHKIYFSKNIKISLPENKAHEYLTNMGPISSREKSIFLIVALSFISITTYSYHRIYPTWITLALVYILLVFEMLNKKNVQENINWPFLIFLACIVGLSTLISYLQIDKLLLSQVNPYIEFFSKSPYKFFSFAIFMTFVVRVFLPIGSSLAILLPIFITLSKACHISSWTVTFTIIMLADCWFLPYQSTNYLVFKTALDRENISFNEVKFLKFNAWMNVVRIISIYASIYYWDKILKI